MIKKNITIFGLGSNIEYNNYIDVSVSGDSYNVKNDSATSTPVAYNSDTIFTGSYNLEYMGSTIMNYYLKYYPLEMLKPTYNDGNIYEKNKQEFINSDYLILLIAQDFFTEGTEMQTVKKIKRKCTRILNPYFSEYANSHNGTLMPIMFVINMSKKIHHKFNNNSLYSIISESFENLSSEYIQKFIMCSDSNKKIGINIPMLIGYDRFFFEEINHMTRKLENTTQNTQSMINDQQEFINMHNNRTFKIMSKGKAKEAASEISKLQNKIQNATNDYNSNPIWKQHEGLHEIIAKEINENSKCLIYGFEQELLYKQNEDNNTFSLLVRIVTLIIILGLLLAIGIFIVPKIQAALLFMH